MTTTDRSYINSLVKMEENGASESRIKHEIYKVLENAVPNMSKETLEKAMAEMIEYVKDIFSKSPSSLSLNWKYRDLLTINGYVEDCIEDFKWE